MEPTIKSFIGHAITSIQIGQQTCPISCLYVGGISFTETVTSITNLSKLKLTFSNCVLTNVCFGDTLTAPPIPLAASTGPKLYPRLYLHFLKVPLLGMIPICCSRRVVIIFLASTPLGAGKGACCFQSCLLHTESLKQSGCNKL